MIDEQALCEAVTLYDQGECQEAEKQLLALADAAQPDDPLLGDALLALIYAENGMNRFDKALSFGLRLLALRQGTPEEPMALHHLAVTERMAGRYDEALQWLKKEQDLLDVSASPDAGLHRGAVLYERGCVALAREEWEGAKLLLDSSLEIGAMTNDALLMGSALRALAQWSQKRGDLLSARGAAEQAADLFKTVGDERASSEITQWLDALDGEMP